MVLKTTSFKLESELLKLIKIRATEKEITQSELVTTYLIKGLEYDFDNEEDITHLLNISYNNHLDRIINDFKIPESIKYNPQKENKPISENSIDFDDEGGKDIFSDVLGIVSSPVRTNSVELKKETYNRG